MVFMRKPKLKFLIIRNDKKNETIKNKMSWYLFFISDFIHFNFGPTAINIKNGIKKGINNLLKKGGPTEIFSFDITSRKIG